MKMSQDELQYFIRRKLRKGYPEGELKNELVAEGYTNEEIEKALYNIVASHPSVTTGTAKFPLWLIFSFGLLIVGIAILNFPLLWLTFLGWPCTLLGSMGILIWYVKKIPGPGAKS